MSRRRQDGYAVTDRAAGLADLLYNVVVRLDCGTAPADLKRDVESIARAMGH